MSKKKFRNKSLEKRIASERIAILFQQAKEKFLSKNKEKNQEIIDEDRTLADRYVHHARNISKKIKVKIPSVYKRQFCKKCGVYLMPGSNCTVRLTGKTITYKCLECNSFQRISYKNKTKKIDNKKIKKNQK